jgi:predicted ribosomally synthesized peptide with SipW-like signal peptide
MLKILGLGAALIIIIATVSVGTYAYFNDVETSTGNVISAGTLNLIPAQVGNYTLNGSSGSMSASPSALGDGVDGHITWSNVSPGQSGTTTFTLYNSGTVDGTLALTGTTVTDSESTPASGPKHTIFVNNGGTDAGLPTYLGVKVTKQVGSSVANATAATATYVLGAAGYYVPASTLEAALAADTASMPANDGAVIYTISWTIQSGIAAPGMEAPPHYGTGTAVASVGGINGDNLIQGDTLTVNVVFTLTQTHS